MRNLKKFLSVLLVIAMLATAMVPAFAAENISEDAQVLADIGMLIGQGDGVTAEYTATDLTRVQTAVLLLRLKGLEATAKNYTGTTNFADVDSNEWYAPYTAYLKANEELGFIGDENGNFGANAKITAQQYYKVLLTALGYEIPTDYSYDLTVEFAKSLGLDAVSGDKEVLTVNDLSVMTVEALKTAVKGGTATLATTLVDAGKIDAVKAEAAGIYAKDPAITSVKAAGVKKVLVTFNKAVDTSKAEVTLKKGSINMNIAEKTFAADAKSVTLETSGDLSDGTYTVNVAGLTATALTSSFDVVDEYVAKIEFNSDNAVLDREDVNIVTASITIYNQYNEDVTEDFYNTDMNYTSSKGDITVDEDGVVTITEDEDYEFEVDDKISITALNSESGVFKSTVLTVVGEAKASTITITQLWNEDEDEELDVEDDDYSEFKLVFEIKDQYGRDIVETLSDSAAVQIAEEDIILTSSDEDVVIADELNFEIVEIDDEDKLVLALEKPDEDDAESGTATITAVSKFTGKLAKFDVVVKDRVLVDTFSMVAPDVAVAGEDVEIAVTAYDYYGNEITDPDDIEAGLDDYGVSGNRELDEDNITFKKDYVTGKINMVLDTTGVTEEDTVIVRAVTDSNKLVQVSIRLRDPAEVSVVSGVDKDDVKTRVLLDNVMTMDYETLLVDDQYDREVDSDDIFSLNGVEYRYTVKTDSASKVQLSGTDVTKVSADVYALASKAGKITFKGLDTGSSKITITAQEKDGNTWVDVKGSAYSFTLSVVENDDISSYKVEEIEKLYDAYVRTNGEDFRGNEDYAKEVKVVGILSNGAEVDVPSGTGIYSVTVTKGGVNVVTIDGESRIWVTEKTSLADDKDEESTSNAIVTIEGKNGAVVINAPYTISNVKPKIASMKLEDGDVTTAESDSIVSIDRADYVALGANNDARTAALVADVVTTEDQYGVEWEDEGASYTIIATNFENKDGDKVAKDAARNSGDEFQVTAIAKSSGLTMTFKVVID